MASEVDPIAMITSDVFGLSSYRSFEGIGKHPWDTSNLVAKSPEALRTEKELLRKLELTLSDLDAIIRPVPYAGIKNVGATCYLNTFIQSLFFNVEFRNAFVSLDDLVEPPLVALQNLMGDLLLGIMKTVDPIEFVNSLAICRGTQEDSNEFSTLFISWLHKNVVQYPIRSLFEGSLVNSLICPSCGAVTRNSESFMELRIDVNDSSDLSELLKSLSDRFDIIEGYICESDACKGRVVDIAKQTSIERLPKYLTVVINRFSFDRSDGRQKISKPIKIKLDDLELMQGNTYSCFGIIEHVSSSAASGHYIGHFRDFSDSGSWYTFDDAIVKPATKISGQMYTSNTAYVVHYVDLAVDFKTHTPINPALAARISQMNNDRLVALETKKSLKTEIETQMLQRSTMIESLQSYEFVNHQDWIVVSTDWLKEWGHFHDITRVYNGEEKFAHNLPICNHGKISPLSIIRQEVKYVPKELFPSLTSMRVNECACEPCLEDFRNQLRAACAFGESLVELFEDSQEEIVDKATRWVNMRRLRGVFTPSFRKSLSSIESVIRKFMTAKPRPDPIDLDEGVKCIHGNLRHDADVSLEKRPSSFMDELIEISAQCPSFVPRLSSSNETSSEPCIECEQESLLRSTFVELLKRILGRQNVECPVTAVPSAWLRRGIRGVSRTLTEFDSLVCDHGKIRAGGPKYSLLTQDELDSLYSAGFCDRIPIILPDVCDQCLQVNARIVNVRLFDNAVGSGQVVDTERGITIVHRPSSSRLFGSTSDLSLHAESSTGRDLKLRLIDLGIMGDDEVPEGVEDWMNLYISHPLLRGSLIRLEDNLCVNAALNKAMDGLNRTATMTELPGTHDTLYVEVIRSGNIEEEPKKRLRRVRTDDRDAGLKGSILREPKLNKIDDPIDLC